MTLAREGAAGGSAAAAARRQQRAPVVRSSVKPSCTSVLVAEVRQRFCSCSAWHGQGSAGGARSTRPACCAAFCACSARTCAQHVGVSLHQVVQHAQTTALEEVLLRGSGSGRARGERHVVSDTWRRQRRQRRQGPVVVAPPVPPAHLLPRVAPVARDRLHQVVHALALHYEVERELVFGRAPAVRGGAWWWKERRRCQFRVSMWSIPRCAKVGSLGQQTDFVEQQNTTALGIPV